MNKPTWHLWQRRPTHNPPTTDQIELGVRAAAHLVDTSSPATYRLAAIPGPYRWASHPHRWQADEQTSRLR